MSSSFVESDAFKIMLLCLGLPLVTCWVLVVSRHCRPKEESLVDHGPCKPQSEEFGGGENTDNADDEDRDIEAFGGADDE